LRGVEISDNQLSIFAAVFYLSFLLDM